MEIAYKSKEQKALERVYNRAGDKLEKWCDEYNRVTEYTLINGVSSLRKRYGYYESNSKTPADFTARAESEGLELCYPWVAPEDIVAKARSERTPADYKKVHRKTLAYLRHIEKKIAEYRDKLKTAKDALADWLMENNYVAYCDFVRGDRVVNPL